MTVSAMMFSMLSVAQCNRRTMFKGKNVKPQWCTTCRQYLGKRETCPVISMLAAPANSPQLNPLQ